MFSLLRTKCSRTSMTYKKKTKSNTTQSHMQTQTPKVYDSFAQGYARRYEHFLNLCLVRVTLVFVCF